MAGAHQTPATLRGAARVRARSEWSRSLAHVLAVAAAYALLAAVFFSPVVFAGRLLAPGDGTLYFLPNFLTQRAFWDSSIWLGTPAFADPQAMAWYPPALICRLLPPFAGWNALMLSAYILAASFAYGYVYRLTRSRTASAVAGTTYALCGFMLAHTVHASLVHAAAWLPLFVWSLEELRRDDSSARFWFVTSALATACAALAGHPQVFVYTLALGAAVIIFNARRAPAGWLRYLARAALAIAFGVGLVALQLAPAAELARLSVRASLGFSEFVAYQLPLRQLPTFVYPLLYGGAPQTFYQLPYFGAWASEATGWNASELVGYVGVLPLLLAAVALLSYTRRRHARFWCGVAIVALLLALGESAPLAFLTYRLPLFNKFRAPARHLLEFSFAASVLAGLGAHAIASRAVAVRLVKHVALAGACAVLLCLGAVLLHTRQLNEQAAGVAGRTLSFAPWANPAVLVPLLVLAGSTVALLYWSRRPASKPRTTLLLLALVCDLASFGQFAEWRYLSPDAATLAPPTHVHALRDALTQAHQRVLPVRGSLGAKDELPPNLSKLWGLESASGYGPLMLARISQLLSMQPYGAVDDSWSADSNRGLDVAAVRYVLIPRDDAGQSPTAATIAAAQTPASNALNLVLGEGCGAARKDIRITLPASASATRLRITSALACSETVTDGAPVLNVTLRDAAGNSTTQQLAAGRDTSEWAYDCADVRPRVRHARASVESTYATTRPPAPCVGHDYASELPLLPAARESGATPQFDASSIRSVELRWAGGTGSIAIKSLTLLDEQSGHGRAVSSGEVALGDESRWRLVAEAGAARVYENLRARPRAWLVGETLTVTAGEALAALRTSRLSDGRDFDPARTALVEEPLAQERVSFDPASSKARVVENSGASIAVETESNSPAFLILSDAYYPGWRATVDGREARIYNTDYALRGVSLPSGRHAVRFEFRPRSFRVNLFVSLLSLAALFGIAVASLLLRKKTRIRAGDADAPADEDAPVKERSSPGEHHHDREAMAGGGGRQLVSAFASLLDGEYAEKSRGARLLLSALVFLWPLAYLSNLVFTTDGRYTGIDNDFGYAYYNYKVYLLDELSRLRFPLWSPSEAAGFPFYSSPLPATCYPLNLLLAAFYRLAGGYTLYDHQLFTVLGVSVFALGLFHWLRLLPLRLRPILFATLVMSVSFKVTETLRFPNSIHTACWQPWILFALTSIFASRTLMGAIRYGLLLALFFALHLTGGYPYFVFYTIFLVGPYLLVFLWPPLRRRLWRRSAGDLRVALAVACAAGLFALAACAPHLLSVSRLMKETVNRGGNDFDYATAHEFRPIHTVGSLLFPPASQPEGWYYFGLVGLLLLLFYLFDAGRPLLFARGAPKVVATGKGEGAAASNRESEGGAVKSGGPAWYHDRGVKIFFLAWFTLVSYITYGRRSYLFALLWKVMPLFASLRVWGRLNIILVPVIAWALAIAYTHFEDRLARRGELEAPADVGRQGPFFKTWSPLATLAACYLVILSAQLYLFTRKLYDFYWTQLGDFRELRPKDALFIVTGCFAFLAIAWLICAARSRALRTPKALALIFIVLLFVSAFDTRPVGTQTWTYQATRQPRVRRDVAQQVANSFNVPRTDEEKLIPAVEPFNVGVMGNWYFRRYVDFLERAAREPEAKRRLLGVANGRKLFFTRSLEHPSLQSFLDDDADTGGAARPVSYTGDELVAVCDAPAEGYLSFIDNWDAGWEATVDGRAAPIELLFGTFKSVRVPAGAHRVAFSYRPKFFGGR